MFQGSFTSTGLSRDMNGRRTVTLFHTSFQGSCRHRRIYHSIPILLCGKLGICPLKRNCLLNSHKLWRLYRFTKISSSFFSFSFYFIFKNAHKHTHEHFPPLHLSQDCVIQKVSKEFLLLAPYGAWGSFSSRSSFYHISSQTQRLF